MQIYLQFIKGKQAENIISKPKTRTPVRLGHVAHAALA